MTTQAPNSGDPGVQAWHDTSHAALVGAKGWKGPNDVLASYAELEKFRGAPADRLIMLPESADKIDDTFRSDVFKRIGYNPSRAPASADKYTAKFEGAPDEFAPEVYKIAHKHGISDEALNEFAKFNGDFGKKTQEKMLADQKTEDDKLFGDRHAAVEAKLKERFGDKYDASTELMTREAVRLGFKDGAELEAYERNLALGNDGDLLRWRSVLADIADLRRESPLHPPSGGAMTAQSAAAKLAELSKNPEWAKKALTRDTAEAAENLRLNMLAAGGSVDDAEIQRMAKGLAAKATAE